MKKNKIKIKMLEREAMTKIIQMKKKLKKK